MTFNEGDVRANFHGPSKMRARIGFAAFRHFSARRSRSPGPSRSQIARTRADFERFSVKYRKLMDWVVEQKGFELAAPRSVLFGKLSATLAQYLAERKAAVPERISSPEIRLVISEPLARSAPVLGTRTDLPTPVADLGAAGLASEAKQSNVCGCPLRRVDSP